MADGRDEKTTASLLHLKGINSHSFGKGEDKVKIHKALLLPTT